MAKVMANLSPEQREKFNDTNGRKAQAEHAAFKKAFGVGNCHSCGDPLTAFDAANPCRHWLLKPEGFRKDHLELLARRHGWQELELYLRWVANEEAFAQNINDLAEEGTGKLVEITLKYKDLEWSFSCGANDLNGHESESAASRVPHYHFQMRVGQQAFIRYNDFHLPLSVADAGFLNYVRDHPEPVRRRLFGGAGMTELLDESTLEQLVTFGRSGESEADAERAAIGLDTFIVAEPGKMIKGEDIMQIIQAAKAEGVTFTSKAQELEGVRIQTIVSPGPGVVRQALRTGRSRRSKILREQDRVWREIQKRQED